MRKIYSFILMIFLFSSFAQGATILTASVSSPSGDFGGFFALANITNQNGLSANYVNGVTDFDTFVSGTTHTGNVQNNSGFVAGTGAPEQFTFNFGSIQTISGLAFWAELDGGTVTQFELFLDNDTSFANGTTAQVGGTFNALADASGGASGQVFLFGNQTTQFIHLNALNTAAGGGGQIGIGEVAFRSGDGVPEPSTYIAFLLGFALLGLNRFRK